MYQTWPCRRCCILYGLLSIARNAGKYGFNHSSRFIWPNWYCGTKGNKQHRSSPIFGITSSCKKWVVKVSKWVGNMDMIRTCISLLSLSSLLRSWVWVGMAVWICPLWRSSMRNSWKYSSNCTMRSDCTDLYHSIYIKIYQLSWVKRLKETYLWHSKPGRNSLIFWKKRTHGRMWL